MMADDLPPLESQPDSTNIPSDLLGQLQHASQWAGTFGGSDTNIAERARHNQDITQYANALNQTRAAAQLQQLQTNQVAQNLWMNTQKLQLQQQQATARMQIEAAQLQATGATERRKAAEALAMANDTAGFNAHMANVISSGVNPQSPEYQTAVASGLATFPRVNPQDASKFGGSLFPGQKLNPDEILQRINSIQSQNGNLQVSVNPQGATSVVAKPTDINPAQQRAALADQMKDDRLRDGEIEKQLGTLTADNPWLKTTTGPFTHTDGKQYFGNSLATDSTATLQQVTPTAQDAYARYNSALKERALIAERHPQLQQQMSQLILGTPAASTSVKLNPLTDEAAQQARTAISSGKNAEAVRARLREHGFDPSGL